MSQKKKGAVYGVITLMLCFAVYLNWSYSRQEGEEQLEVADQTQQELTAGKIYGQAEETGQTDESGDPAVETAETADTEQSAVPTDGDYFEQARQSRQQARDSAVSILQQTVDNENATEDAKSQASEQIATLADRSVQEAQSESMIKAKGYRDAVVFIQDDGVNVIVAAPESGFTAEDAAKIRDVLLGELEVTAEQIKIVEAA